MKYKIRIDGGFTGFPREYEGDIKLEARKAEELLLALDTSSRKVEGEWPDALHYTIEVQQDAIIRKAVFSEPGVPVVLREFLQLIRDINHKSSNRRDA